MIFRHETKRRRYLHMNSIFTKKNFSSWLKVVLICLLAATLFVGCYEQDGDNKGQTDVTPTPLPEQLSTTQDEISDFVITLEPTNASYLKGDTPSPLSVEASGEGNINYQWFEVLQGTEHSAVEDGGTKNFLPSTEQTGARQYYCLVTRINADGTVEAIKSQTIMVAVNESGEAPEQTSSNSSSGSSSSGSGLWISRQPVSTTVRVGESMTLSLEARGSGALSYQWYTSIYSGANPAVIIENQRESALVMQTGAAYSQLYYCVVTDQTGASVRSNIVTATVLDNPQPAATPTPTPTPTSTSTPKPAEKPVITSTLASKIYVQSDTEVASNKLYSFTASVTPPTSGTLSYQWYRDGSAIVGATSDTYTPQSTDLKLNGTVEFYCIVTNTDGTTSATTQTNTAVLTLNP